MKADKSPPLLKKGTACPRTASTLQAFEKA